VAIIAASAVGGLSVLAGIGAAAGGDDPTRGPTAAGAAPKVERPAPAPDPAPAPKAEAPKADPAPAPAPAPAETAGQENARESAESYLGFTAFSRQSLIEQLVFEGYSTKDATYAVDAVSPDWNEQAAKSARSYLDMTSFSRSGLVEQLRFEGYTEQQAVYGVNQTGL
jgi:hypothetical protein